MSNNHHQNNVSSQRNNNPNNKNFSQNGKNASSKNEALFAIPNKQKTLLENPNCNFSLYSPRMVSWKIEKNELKADTETIAKLNEKTKSLFSSSAMQEEISKKQQRQNAYMEFLKQQGIQTVSITAKTASPFVTGLGSGHPTETGMILDRNLGIPYIPASSIKGVLRLAYAINISNGRTSVPKSELEIYFGTDDRNQKNQYKGQLVILDAYPKESVKLSVDIMNPHFSKYYSGDGKSQPVETESPNPIQFLIVQQGTEFVFNCAFVPLDKEKALSETEKKEIEAMFRTAFTKVGFGGKTAIGYGRFATVSDKTEVAKSEQPKNVRKDDLAAGEYEAVIIDLDKKRASIYFEIGKSKERAVLRNCNGKILSSFRKKDKVKIKIDGKKNNAGDYTAETILSKL